MFVGERDMWSQWTVYHPAEPIEDQREIRFDTSRAGNLGQPSAAFTVQWQALQRSLERRDASGRIEMRASSWHHLYDAASMSVGCLSERHIIDADRLALQPALHLSVPRLTAEFSTRNVNSQNKWFIFHTKNQSACKRFSFFLTFFTSLLVSRTRRRRISVSNRVRVRLPSVFVAACCFAWGTFSVGGRNSFSRFSFLRCFDTSVLFSSLVWWDSDFFWRRSASRAKYSPDSNSLST